MNNQSDSNAAMSFYGFPEEATNFERRHPLWQERMTRLTHAINSAFTRTQMMTSAEDKFVYFYGTLVAEDFMEIFLVAVNGYGIAAMKLVRSMYEHTVTLRYLHDHPNEVGAFIDYDHVQQYKLMKPIMETFGKDVLPAETVADVERRYGEVRDKFMVKSCDCGAMRVNHTWSKLDFVSMAKKSGALGTLIVPGYFWPLRHGHSTFRAITDRMQTVDGRMEFKRESQPVLADQALGLAHNCILVVLEIQNERFKVEGLGAEIQACVRDWVETWAPNSTLLKEGDSTKTAEGNVGQS